ncbi:T-cell surface antigen CD2 [Tupaia chinensis]|uniref:T-cell surface antigen CD2 n=1 Tax=Tupaia chinensis TaxID=246437 RepID=UPI0003C8DEDE|nr:T-cell surface antigen CD2 [Tupaia chinensis]
MSLPYHILASFLLIFSSSAKGQDSEPIPLCGVVDQDINLDIPDFSMSDLVDDIQWRIGSNKSKVAQFHRDRNNTSPIERYEILQNGTLKIKHLKKNDNNTYKVSIFNKKGKSLLERSFNLKIVEMVSKPKISWNCVNKTLTCEILDGTDPQLKLSQKGRQLGSILQKVLTHKWTSKLPTEVTCTAKNSLSEKSTVTAISCSEKGLNIYLIIGTCVAGTLLMVFVALLIFYISRRKKQNRRKNDAELELKAHRVTTKERARKPNQIPATMPQNPAASQPPPPPPGHRSHAPGHRQVPAGHRVQHQQQKRPPPSGTQVHQQKGPPLPRPRVQPKPPPGATEKSPSH